MHGTLEKWTQFSYACWKAELIDLARFQRRNRLRTIDIAIKAQVFLRKPKNEQ